MQIFTVYWLWKQPISKETNNDRDLKFRAGYATEHSQPDNIAPLCKYLFINCKNQCYQILTYGFPHGGRDSNKEPGQKKRDVWFKKIVWCTYMLLILTPPPQWWSFLRNFLKTESTGENSEFLNSWIIIVIILWNLHSGTNLMGYNYGTGFTS